MEKNNNIAMLCNTILLCTFLVLKVTNYIDWSWWWVFSPVWIPISLSIALLPVHVYLKRRERKERERIKKILFKND